ncbi:MAG: hypothetical protein ACLFRU_10520 [Paracoccaceae bacterium]
MDSAYVIPALAILTLAIVLVWALRSKKRVEDRRHDPETPPSSLARDGDPHHKSS